MRSILLMSLHSKGFLFVFIKSLTMIMKQSLQSNQTGRQGKRRDDKKVHIRFDICTIK